MKFLVQRQKNVREILALCVSPNKRVIAVCERGRAPDEDPSSAQVRILKTTDKNIRWLSGFVNAGPREIVRNVLVDEIKGTDVPCSPRVCF